MSRCDCASDGDTTARHRDRASHAGGASWGADWKRDDYTPNANTAEPCTADDPRNVPHRKLTDAEMRYLRHYFHGITDQEGCAKFLEEFLSKAAELNPSNKLVSNDIQSMFESVASGGGFYSAPRASYNTVGGDITNNTGAIYFIKDPRFYSYGPVNRGAELAFLSGAFHSMAQTATHELFHHAGFGDRALANTAAFFRGEKVSFANTWEGTEAASTYWNNALKDHCH